jgi:hypothetical protein
MLLAQRKAEAAATRQAENQMQIELEVQAKQAAWYSSSYQKGLNIAYEMERYRKRLELTEDRISFITLESQAPGFAHVFSLARPSTVAFSGGRKKLFLMVLAAAVLLGLLVPTGIDMLDPHLRSANEAQKLVGFAPVGYTLDARRVGAAEVSDRLRRLATALGRDLERKGSRSFLFLPVNQHSGLDALLAALARELVALGQKVDVVSTAGRVAEATLPGNGQLPLESLRARIAEIRSGMVLVAAAPLSEDAEGELLATSCDVVVLAVQAGITTKAELRAALRTLEQIQPHAVSLLVTGYDPDPPLPPPPRGIRPLARLWARVRGEAANQKGAA